MILLAIVVLLLQSFLIPLLGMTGAAWATCVASFFYNGLLFWFVHKHFRLQPFERGNLIVLFLVLLLFVAGWFLPSTGVPFWNIAYKSMLISSVYLLVVYRTNIAPEAFDWIPFLKKK